VLSRGNPKVPAESNTNHRRQSISDRLLALILCSTLSAAVTIPEFLARRDYPSAGGKVTVGDVTGDGIPDIVAAAFGYSISVMI